MLTLGSLLTKPLEGFLSPTSRRSWKLESLFLKEFLEWLLLEVLSYYRVRFKVFCLGSELAVYTAFYELGVVGFPNFGHISLKRTSMAMYILRKKRTVMEENTRMRVPVWCPQLKCPWNGVELIGARMRVPMMQKLFKTRMRNKRRKAEEKAAKAVRFSGT